jgi:hypothetical protein
MINYKCSHCDGTGIEPAETSAYPPEPCSECCNNSDNIPPDEQPAKVLLRDFKQHEPWCYMCDRPVSDCACRNEEEVPADVDAAHPDGRGMTGDGGEGSVGKRASAVSRETVTEWLRRNGAL